MKKKIFTALGVMTGTSMDGVDISLIKSDGDADYAHILDNYFKFDYELQKRLTNLRNKLFVFEDLEKNFKELNDVEILADEDRYTINIRLSFEITTIGANIVINILLNENSLIISDPLSSIGPNASELVQVGQIGSATAFGGSAGIGVVGGGGY